MADQTPRTRTEVLSPFNPLNPNRGVETDGSAADRRVPPRVAPT